MTGGDKSLATVEGKEAAAAGTLVLQRPARDAGGTWPMLTRSNYADWSLVMQVMLEARQLWVAVSTGTAERETDRTAMECLLRSVPPEMFSMLARKPTAKEAWETVKMMQLGALRVQEAKAMVLNTQFDSIWFKEGDDVVDFGMRLQTLVSHLSLLGVKKTEGDVVRKFISVVPRRLKQIAHSITTLLDINTLSVEELVGRLKASEDCEEEEPESKESGRLLLTEEEWFVRSRQQSAAGASSSSTSRSRGRAHGRRRGGRGQSAQGGGGRGVSRDTCRYYGVAGHWAKDYRKKKREEAHLVQGGTGAGGKDEALFMTQACVLPAPAAPQLTTPAGDAQPGVTAPTTSTRPMAETASRSVAEGEVQAAPTQLPTKIHWVAQWDLPAEVQPEVAQPRRLEEATRLEQPDAYARWMQPEA